MSGTAQTPAEARARYEAALATHSLMQGAWHQTADDGRHIACALGVIGDISSAKECPAQIMPRWLAQMVVYFFDGQSKKDAFAWGSKFYAEIECLNGVVPFSVVHDWQANVVGPLAIEVATKRKRNVAAHEALKAMQAEALAGKKFTADEWRPILKAAFYDADANANAYAYAKKAAVKRLADGMLECLARVEA